MIRVHQLFATCQRADADVHCVIRIYTICCTFHFTFIH